MLLLRRLGLLLIFCLLAAAVVDHKVLVQTVKPMLLAAVLVVFYITLRLLFPLARTQLVLALAALVAR
jgi:hypothetical protein